MFRYTFASSTESERPTKVKIERKSCSKGIEGAPVLHSEPGARPSVEGVDAGWCGRMWPPGAWVLTFFPQAANAAVHFGI